MIAFVGGIGGRWEVAGRRGAKCVEVKRSSKGDGRKRSVVKCKEEDEVLQGATADWRKFRAQLIASERKHKLESRWAHEVSTVEKGCILVASPSYFNDEQEYFAQTVVFVLEHCEHGSVGVILNRPLAHRFEEVQLASGTSDVTWTLRNAFRESALYLGGPVGMDKLLVLHDCDDVEGADQIVPGIYSGGLESILQQAKHGKVDTKRFRFFCGYSGWNYEQLEEEVRQGVWIVAASSNDVMTDHCIQLPRPLWRQVLDLMGGKFADISSRLDELDGGKYKV